MDLSVVIVALDGRDMTLECLATIAGAAEGLDHEIILVDNGSTDGTADAAAGLARVIRNPDNRGYGPAANQGMRASSGRIIALVNNDTRLPRRSLRELVAFLDRTPRCGIVGPQLLHEDGRTQHSFDVEPSVATELLNKSLLRRLRPGAYPSRLQNRTEPFAVDNLVGACFVLRRAILDELGPFDETFFYLYEETDLCRRARDRGWTVMVHPSVSITHLQGRTRSRVRVRARIEQARSRFAYFRKHRPAAHVALRILYPLKCLVETIAWGVAVVLTLGIWPRARGRFAEAGAVLGWQLVGCPRRLGLDRRATLRESLSVGDFVRITQGAFEDFDGRVESLHPGRDLVTVAIDIMGRKTTVEVERSDVMRSAPRRLTKGADA
jgi:N-acetylglucosaminyl-diphospho-decaprenol L-rhamnosyltransferase